MVGHLYRILDSEMYQAEAKEGTHGLGGERRCCNISSFWASVNCFLRPRRLAPARTPSEKIKKNKVT